MLVFKELNIAAFFARPAQVVSNCISQGIFQQRSANNGECAMFRPFYFACRKPHKFFEDFSIDLSRISQVSQRLTKRFSHGILPPDDTEARQRRLSRKKARRLRLRLNQ
jgi:hypothetical protein